MGNSILMSFEAYALRFHRPPDHTHIFSPSNFKLPGTPQTWSNSPVTNSEQYFDIGEHLSESRSLY